MLARVRKALLAITAVVLATVASLMAVEVLSIIVLSLKDHTYISARDASATTHHGYEHFQSA